ncbi:MULTISPECIES: carbon storage regulator [Bacillaceae]|uniref:Carbon storage regulator n=1 Tax=Evansella alkalicola TaxID=745819 RepID=A0ABS6JUM9_9BACI|nr:carbon storage regulator [Litchfieldia alkalitelluris]MBU9722288.1 carbon storage regulator [Bacillus alkalicola]
MLVLQCKVGDCIAIGENVTVRVVQGKKGQLRLAIDAPREIAIQRQETDKPLSQLVAVN